MKCQHQKGFYQQPDRSNDLVLLRKTATAGRIPIHHRQSVNHGQPMMLGSNYGMRVTENIDTAGQGPWACDYCQVATFETFAEAAQHEKTCPMNQNLLGTQSQSLSRHYFANQTSTEASPPLALCMPADDGSLSDRQCYVRRHFVELFTARESDVASRHSKGAQKLNIGQIGIRCKHCVNLRSKDRAERAICYPSSISRIYQTVADMQRFHFAACSAIPTEMKNIYKELKTTRPRGVGSPQAYWISSARELGLVDSDRGIRYDPNSDRSLGSQYHSMEVSSLSSISSTNSSNLNLSPRSMQAVSSPLIIKSPYLPPLSPESHSTSQSLPHEQSEGSDYEMNDRDSEANMLLALKNTRTDFSVSGQRPQPNFR